MKTIINKLVLAIANTEIVRSAVRGLAEDYIGKVVDSSSFAATMDNKVSAALAAADIESKVESAIEDADIERKAEQEVESAAEYWMDRNVSDYANDAVTEAANEYDFSREAEKAVEQAIADTDLDDQVADAVRDADIDAKVREAVDRETKGLSSETSEQGSDIAGLYQELETMREEIKALREQKASSPKALIAELGQMLTAQTDDSEIKAELAELRGSVERLERVLGAIQTGLYSAASAE